MHTSAVSPRLCCNWTDALTPRARHRFLPFGWGRRSVWRSLSPFSLERDKPFWAGTSAAIVCQAQLGASLRKGWFRDDRYRGQQVRQIAVAQLGDLVEAGVNGISVVDANSFWVDRYFEETNLVPIGAGDAAQVKLIGHGQVVRGHVDNIVRGINIANAQPNNHGVANVNAIFTWVRLAPRIPVRIPIDDVPAGIVLVAGMTATVEIDARTRTAAK